MHVYYIFNANIWGPSDRAGSFILFTFSALLNDEQQENVPISTANVTQVTERVPVERQSERTPPLTPQTTRYNRLMRKAGAVPKKPAAVDQHLKHAECQLLDDCTQYTVSACLGSDYTTE